MDKFAGRYGWDHNTILSLPASTFVGYYGAIKKGERLDFQKQMKAAAFTSYRVEMAISGIMGGSSKATYTDYLEAHNLLTAEERERNRLTKKLRKLQNKQKAKEGERAAAEIMAADPLRLKSLQETGATGKGG